MTERYYCRGPDGELTARDGPGGVKRRLFSSSSVFNKQIAGRSIHVGLRLLADALDSKTRARAAGGLFFPRDAVAPDVTRSRVHVYVDMIDYEKRAGLAPDQRTISPRDVP